MKTVMTLVCVILSLGWGGVGMAQDRLPEILMDQYLLEGTEALEKGEPDRARRAFGKIEALEVEPPPAFLFAEGQLVVAQGRVVADRQRQEQFGEHLRMVSTPGGSFKMGCTSEQRECGDDEYPVHEVQVRAFEIGQYEVTQALWEAVMGGNPSRFKNCGAQCPVENVDWDAVQRFLKRLNMQTGSQYRLPTEAEWEYAARGGQQSRGYQYAGSDDPGVVAWYAGNSGKETTPVGQKGANELGLYDMSGNVREWVQDCWHGSYKGAPSDGRAWESENSGDCSYRVLRGGSWVSEPWDLRSANRDWNRSGVRLINNGFRLARTLTP